jgi:hypothetical protein
VIKISSVDASCAKDICGMLATNALAISKSDLLCAIWASPLFS